MACTIFSIYDLYTPVNIDGPRTHFWKTRFKGTWLGADALVLLMTSCTRLPIISGKDQELAVISGKNQELPVISGKDQGRQWWWWRCHWALVFPHHTRATWWYPCSSHDGIRALTYDGIRASTTIVSVLRWYRATHIVGDLFFWQARPPCIIIRIAPETRQHLLYNCQKAKVLFLETMWPL